MQHTAHSSMPDQQLTRSVLGRSRMNHGWVVSASSQPELIIKTLLLTPPGFSIVTRVEKVQAHLPQSNNPVYRMAVGGKMRIDPLRVGQRRLGMLADARPDIRMALRKIQNFLQRLLFNPNTQKTAYAR